MAGGLRALSGSLAKLVGDLLATPGEGGVVDDADAADAAAHDRGGAR